MKPSPAVLFTLLFAAEALGGVGLEISAIAIENPSLDSPSYLAYHPSGLWVISDTGNDRVVLLNIDLTPNSTLSGVLERPRGVAVDTEGRIMVCDAGNGRVVRFGVDLALLGEITSLGEGQGQLNLPWGIAVDQEGRVAISDALDRRVVVLGADGDWTTIGTWGTAPGEFDGPLDLAFDSAGRLYVVDTYLEAEGYVRRLQIFNPDLSYNSTIWDIQNRLRFTRPVGVGVSPAGAVAVADSFADRVYFFTPWGEHLGGLTEVAGQPPMSDPYDVAFGTDPRGGELLAIVERKENRVRVLAFSLPEAPVIGMLLISLVGLLRLYRGGETTRGRRRAFPRQWCPRP